MALAERYDLSTKEEEKLQRRLFGKSLTDPADLSAAGSAVNSSTVLVGWLTPYDDDGAARAADGAKRPRSGDSGWLCLRDARTKIPVCASRRAALRPEQLDCLVLVDHWALVAEPLPHVALDAPVRVVIRARKPPKKPSAAYEVHEVPRALLRQGAARRLLHIRGECTALSELVDFRATRRQEAAESCFVVELCGEPGVAVDLGAFGGSQICGSQFCASQVCGTGTPSPSPQRRACAHVLFRGAAARKWRAGQRGGGRYAPPHQRPTGGFERSAEARRRIPHPADLVPRCC